MTVRPLHPTSPLRAHVFQHVPFEGLGQMESWLARAGAQLSTTRFYESPVLPDLDAADFLIVLGGPMSVHDEALHPWLANEKGFIGRFLATGKPMLGLCLGAQLMASALGARIGRNPEPEIGWFPIEGIPPPANRPAFHFPASTEVFHWHGETFDLPHGAIRLARSSACENQAFQLGSAIGLQFHLETTPESAQALVENARNEWGPAPFVQSEEELRTVPVSRYQALHRLLDDLLAHLLPGSALPLS